LIAGSGALAACAQLGLHVPAGPVGGASLPMSLLLSGAGAGIIIAAWDSCKATRLAEQFRRQALRAEAQRELAVLQSRRLRAQAEGLALMREIHRSTAITHRHERLHRILELLADLFEAREVSLFAVQERSSSAAASRVFPAACLRITRKEEFFVAFETEELVRLAEQSSTDLHKPAPPIRVARNGAGIVREGCHLFVEGSLECSGTNVAKAQWRRGAGLEQDPLSTQDPAEILENALVKIEFGATACAMAAQAVVSRRTIRTDDARSAGKDRPNGLTLCVPLIADQRTVGVLKVRRSTDGFDGAEAEAIEEMLLESAKHIALAMKKDEDDRKAITDVLTSLYIKRHFLEMIEHLRADASANGSGFCMVLCDIDHFKKVNDTHGHLSGDMVLRGVAGVLRKGLRSGDMAFRYGGEEMALLLPGASLESAEQTAERMRLAVQAAVLKGEKGQLVPITISLGVVHYQPSVTADTLISRADRALYSSKQNGRNRATSWSPTLPDPLAKKESPQASPAK